MSLKENITMLGIERQMVVDREKKRLEKIDCPFVINRLEEAEMKLRWAKERQHGS